MPTGKYFRILDFTDTGKLCFYLLLFFLSSFAQAADVLQLQLRPLPPGMTRAELFYLKPDTNKKLKGILILCPGSNGIGKGYVLNKTWQAYAEKMQLGLVGLSFASEVADLRNGNGYYYVHKGSGNLLLDGLKSIYKQDLPILLYGFSGGAHFTARFTEWKSDRVLTWCAYSAGWWDKPLNAEFMPPGIVACGVEDERLDASQGYFWDGREVGKPWLWIDIKDIGHVSSSELDSFVRDYFEFILNENGNIQPFRKGLWVDIYERMPSNAKEAKKRPCAVAWLPDPSLMNKWLSLTKVQYK